MTVHDESYSNLIVQLDSWFNDHQRGGLSKDGPFLCATRAALTKSFEFYSFCRTKSDTDQLVFAAATLRGVCEDIIALCFLEKISAADRNAVIEARLGFNIHQGLKAQAEFFRTVRPWQAVVGPGAMSGADPQAQLKALALKFGWPNGQWPTVRYMARSSGLEYLYDYMYAATSEWVHFSPHILLRMGWGYCSNATAIPDTEMKFSTAHFVEYYKDFTRTYSLYLLALGLRRLAPILDPSFDLSLADGLDKELARSMRWPELITFEELNIKPPSVIHSIFARAVHERGSTIPPSDNGSESS